MFKLCITGDLGFEFWKDIPEYEGYYQASTYGRIRSIFRYKKILKVCNRHRGYGIVTLCVGKKRVSASVHREIAKTFLPKYKSECTQVNHKDENPSNNRVENIEWCDSKYNINYGTGIQRSAEQKYKPIYQFDINGNFIASFQSAKGASKLLGISRGAICLCCKGKHKTAGGYVWKYA